MGHHPQATNGRQTIFQKLVDSLRGQMGSLWPLTIIAFFIFQLPYLASEGLGKSIGVLGDSLSTGAAAHPALRLDTNGLWQVFQDPKLLTPQLEHLNPSIPWIEELKKNSISISGRTQLKAPQKAWPTQRELFHGIDYTFLNFVSALSQNFLNLEEYSWSYQLAPALGVAGDQVIIAAENGARVGSINRQIDRLVAAHQGTVPDYVFIFFTGNDICGPSPESITSAKTYSETIISGLEYLARQKRPETGVKVYVLSYLNITQISTRKEILEKKLSAFGDATTCQDLHKQGFKPTPEQLVKMHEEFLKHIAITSPTGVSTSQKLDNLPTWWPWLFLQVMPPSPADMCPNLFAYGQEPLIKDKNLSTVANIVREYRLKTKEAIALFQEKNLQDSSPFNVAWVENLEDLLFDESDIANDCFHLSGVGQGKLALKIYEKIQSNLP